MAGRGRKARRRARKRARKAQKKAIRKAAKAGDSLVGFSQRLVRKLTRKREAKAIKAQGTPAAAPVKPGRAPEPVTADAAFMQMVRTMSWTAISQRLGRPIKELQARRNCIEFGRCGQPSSRKIMIQSQDMAGLAESFVHKRIIRGALGFVTGGPTAAIAGFVQGGSRERKAQQAVNRTRGFRRGPSLCEPPNRIINGRCQRPRGGRGWSGTEGATWGRDWVRIGVSSHHRSLRNTGDDP